LPRYREEISEEQKVGEDAIDDRSYNRGPEAVFRRSPALAIARRQWAKTAETVWPLSNWLSVSHPQSEVLRMAEKLASESRLRKGGRVFNQKISEVIEKMMEGWEGKLRMLEKGWNERNE
jgi:hypothetical protein